MYKAFNLTGISLEGMNIDPNVKNSYNILVAESQTTLLRHLKNGSINATSLRNESFPIRSHDIFISHSHYDVNDALRLATFLSEQFGLSCFIDSAVWRYSDNLLLEIDNHFCKNPDGQTYSYKMRNRTTTHVHMLLASALSEMINKCEAVFFLNTPNAITTQNSVDRTFSPWIFYELEVIRWIEAQMPQRMLVETRGLGDRMLAYEVNLERLTDLSAKDIERWQSEFRRPLQFGRPIQRMHALDALYELLLNRQEVPLAG